MSENPFRREVLKSDKNSKILIDSKLKSFEYVDSFGFEWTNIDGYASKEVMSHGHIFGRFLLSPDYFQGKVVADIGCGNGRIGRLVAPHTEKYYGIDLSEAVYSFPDYLDRDNVTLIRASGTDLPLVDAIADVTVCWGVLHHMDQPELAYDELLRITKPGGCILIFIYSNAYKPRENLNKFSKEIKEEEKFPLIEKTSDELDSWREVDRFYADIISRNLFMSVKQSREWQIFQWFDGITPSYHWSLEDQLEQYFKSRAQSFVKTQAGCYKITK